VEFACRKFLHIAQHGVAICFFILSGHGAWSQPTGTIKIVVPVSAGGVQDNVARLLAEQIRRGQGQTILVENRSGAGGLVAAEFVSRAAPDGNTLMITSPDLLATLHLRNLSHDLLGLEPVCYLVSVPNIIVVNNASPYRTLADLFAAAGAKPGALTLASAGPASSLEIGFEQLKLAAKVEMTFISYPGAAPAVNALLGGHVTSALASYFTVAEHLSSAKLHTLAVVTKTRIEPLPDVPTVAESGYKDYQLDYWLGVVAPPKTQKETTYQLAGLFTRAVRAGELNSRLLAQGLYPAVTCGAEFGAFLRTQYDEFGRAIREANIKPK